MSFTTIFPVCETLTESFLNTQYLLKTEEGNLNNAAISGDTTISRATHHNKILEVSADAVLTLPNSLTQGTQFIVMPTADDLNIIVETDQAEADTLNDVTDGRWVILPVAYLRAHVYVSSTGKFYIDGAALQSSA